MVLLHSVTFINLKYFAMEKRFFAMLALVLSAVAFTSCEYDDSGLWDKVNSLQEQVTANQEDIATLTSLVEALNKGKVIVATTQTDNGYTLTFSDGSTIEIMNGKDGDSFFVSIVEQDDMVIITLADGRVIKLPVINYELRVLTFEDEDYKGTGGDNYWSSLISSGEYGNGNGQYSWDDENNTELAFYPSSTALFPGYGGHAISNYTGNDLSQGDFMHDLQAYNVTGGANGSDNFCVHFGYLDDSGMGMMNELVYFEFADGESRVIDHMYVTNTTYVYNLLTNGDGWQVPTGAGEDSWFKIVAYGYDENDERCGEAEFYLWNKGRKGVSEWTKWDLASLGKVTRVEFNLVGSDDLYGPYGLGVAGYFAYDDVAVRFEK